VSRVCSVYVDLETAPGRVDHWRTREVVAAALKCDEDVVVWNAPETLAAWSRTALDDTAGRTLAIAYAIDEDPVDVVWVPAPDGRIDDDLEREAFDTFDTRLDGVQALWVAHNGLGFDLPWLRHRGLIVGSRIAQRVPSDRWGKGVYDTSKEWTGDARAKVSLNNLCRLLGVPGKGDITGEQAWLLAASNPARVRLYAAADVCRLRSVHRRMTGRAPLEGDLETIWRDQLEVVGA